MASCCAAAGGGEQGDGGEDDNGRETQMGATLPARRLVVGLGCHTAFSSAGSGDDADEAVATEVWRQPGLPRKPRLRLRRFRHPEGGWV